MEWQTPLLSFNGQKPLEKVPPPYAARVLLCDRAAAVSLVFALCCHNIKICQRREGMKAGGCCYSRAADMKAGSVPEAVELMKNSGLMSFVAVTEHGARMSRTSKDNTAENPQKCNRAKSTQTESKRKARSQRQETDQSSKDGIGLLYNHKAYKKKEQGYYIAQRLYKL